MLWVGFFVFFHSNELNLMVYKLWHKFSVGVTSCLFVNIIFVLLIVFVYCVPACDTGIIDSQTLMTVQVLCCFGKLDCTEESANTIGRRPHHAISACACFKVRLCEVTCFRRFSQELNSYLLHSCDIMIPCHF